MMWVNSAKSGWFNGTMLPSASRNSLPLGSPGWDCDDCQRKYPFACRLHWLFAGVCPVGRMKRSRSTPFSSTQMKPSWSRVGTSCQLRGRWRRSDERDAPRSERLRNGGAPECRSRSPGSRGPCRLWPGCSRSPSGPNRPLAAPAGRPERRSRRSLPLTTEQRSDRQADELVEDHRCDHLEDRDLGQRRPEGCDSGRDRLADLDSQRDQLDNNVDLQGEHHTRRYHEPHADADRGMCAVAQVDQRCCATGPAVLERGNRLPDVPLPDLLPVLVSVVDDALQGAGEVEPDLAHIKELLLVGLRPVVSEHAEQRNQLTGQLQSHRLPAERLVDLLEPTGDVRLGLVETVGHFV